MSVCLTRSPSCRTHAALVASVIPGCCPLAAGRASGQQTAHTPAHWLRRRAADLTGVLPLRARRCRPGAGAVTPHDAADRTTPLGARWQAHAVAATTRRGAIACGAPTHLVSLVRHGSGTTIGHGAVGEQRSALRAVPRLLTGRDLTGTVMASDARPT